MAISHRASTRSGDQLRSSTRPPDCRSPATRSPCPGSARRRCLCSALSRAQRRVQRSAPQSGGTCASENRARCPASTAHRNTQQQKSTVRAPCNGSPTHSGNVFGMFVDSNTLSGVDVPITFSHRLSQFSTRLRYQYTRLTTDATPYFANRGKRILGDAGIGGNNQDLVNWVLRRDVLERHRRARAVRVRLEPGSDALRRRRVSMGARPAYDYGRRRRGVGAGHRRSKIARGAFSFTGAASGSDVADFLLGIPATSSDRFGNADKARERSPTSTLRTTCD